MTAPGAPALSIIAPCYNEEDNVIPLVRRMLAAFDGMPVPAELVLVDDGSTDRTWERIQESRRGTTRIQAVRHAENLGIEHAWRSGLAAARAETVGLVDADLQNRPEDVPELYRALVEGGVDVAQAVRHAQGNSVTRVALSRSLNALLNLAFGMRLRDSKSGFLLCRRQVLEDVLQHRLRYRYFQAFLGVAAGVRGYRFAEVDTTFEPRRAGQSFLGDLPIAPSLRILVELLKYRYETLGLPPRRRGTTR